MDRERFVERVSWRVGSTAEEADRLLEAILEELGTVLATKEPLDLGALGTFHPGAATGLAGVRFVPGPVVEAAAQHAAG